MMAARNRIGNNMNAIQWTGDKEKIANFLGRFNIPEPQYEIRGGLETFILCNFRVWPGDWIFKSEDPSLIFDVSDRLTKESNSV
jgi:hypothetical protein